MKHAHVVLCQKTGGFHSFLTYSIPPEWESECRLGSFVQVSLRQKMVRALVVKLENEQRPSAFKIKPIQSVFKETYLPSSHLRLAFEMADYYCTSLAKVLRMMLPRSIWEGTFKVPTLLFYCLKPLHKELKGKKQQMVIEALQKEGGEMELKHLKERVKGLSTATLKNLVEKGVLETREEKAYPGPPLASSVQKKPVHALTPDQKEAFEAIKRVKKPILLHGVTGSGKTELYLRVILETLEQGKQALLMVPEIALTPQMIDYFKVYVGKGLVVMHSKLSQGERASHWYQVQSGQACLVIGSRSAVFAPVRQWGCIIMDEEHEWTYKQESTPYYQTHFIVERWQKWMGSTVVLGSATPRLESFQKVQEGDYHYFHLPERIGKAPLPILHIVDLREEFKQRHFSVFSRALLRAMDETLKKGEQVMLFVNQRGSARAVVCRDCGEVSMCSSCEARLTFHRYSGSEKLVCHHCGGTYPMPLQCAQCDSVHIKHIGVGTQRVEEECRRYFPDFKVIRADQDSTRLKDGFLNLYQTFKAREADILVGTQMIAKGLHFEGVALIGIVLADIGLNLPDFRAHERAFQLVTQVSGRSGRGQTAGKVILQTYQPEHLVFKQAQQNDYLPFARQELELRQKHSYPPFGTLIKFIVLGTHPENLLSFLRAEKKQMEALSEAHQLNLKISLAPAMVPKISHQYYFHVLVQGKNPHALFKHWSIPSGWRVDVDPVRMG